MSARAAPAAVSTASGSWRPSTARRAAARSAPAPLTALGPQNVKSIPEPIDVWRVEVEGVRPAKTATKTAILPSLVVLPFDNMSSDPEQEFLADGIVEDVTTELSRFRTLTVIARNSAFTYKGAPKDVREIAKELDVRYVFEGSVRRASLGGTVGQDNGGPLRCARRANQRDCFRG